ncbi:MAG: kinase [Alphaproteobacteria bacterium]
MIIARTPYRISFFGGGTDFPGYYREHGGAVLSTTINRYVYATCRYLPPFFSHKSRVVWSKIETVSEHAKLDNPVVRAALEFLKIDRGIEVHYQGDLPARSGLGSSSSFTVGLLHALHGLQGHHVSKEQLAHQAIHIERTMLAEPGGVQDQIAAAYGGLSRIDFHRDDSFVVTPMMVGAQRMRDLEQHMLLFYTGLSRDASTIEREKTSRVDKIQNDLRLIQDMVEEGEKLLTGDAPFDAFGALLHEAWTVKRRLSDKVAPSFIDQIYEKAMQAGASGGKLLGAGGGGFLLFIVSPDRHAPVLEALEDLLVVPVQIDRRGSQIIFYEPEPHTRTSLVRRDFRAFNLNGG